YHGTNADFDTFDRAKGQNQQYGPGFYFTPDPRRARNYGDTIRPVFLRALNDNRDARRKGVEKDHLRTRDGTDYWIVYAPSQIKSATDNTGAFDPGNDSILYQQAAGERGRAQPLTAKVLTPSGYRPMGEIRVGDEVIAADGSVTAVEGVYPQGVNPVFRITLSDGSTTRSTADHLWKARSEPDRDFTVMPLSWIMAGMRGGQRYEIAPLGRQE
ncbi:MAG: hypothetical protein LBI87_12460, partial [Candidatus Accumulibacter sp.]|nr:hypothetical protein [Accumulibacter sp.]